MASSGNNQIVVRGIPSHLNSDKLIIYFQRKRDVGGGDVQSVIFPKSKNEPDTAIVTFEDPETVQSVLKYEHKIGGKQVVVKENTYKKIFGPIKTNISSSAIEEIRRRYRDVDEKFYQVMDSTGAIISPQSDGNYEVSGDWLQVQAAYERIVDLVGCQDDQGEPGYLDRPDSSNSTPTVNSPVRDLSMPKVYSAMLDKDIFAYVQLVHQEELNKLSEQHDVTFEMGQIGDAIKVSATSTAHPANAEEAIKRLQEVYSKISKSAHQDDARLDTTVKGYKEIADDVITKLQPEFPRVIISRMHDDEECVIFIAPTAEDCGRAKDMFKYFLNQAISTAGQAGNGAESNAVIKVDRDVLGYLFLAYSDKLQTIWDDHGVKIRIKPIDECVEVHLKPKADSGSCRPAEAKAAFTELYQCVNRKVQVNEQDLSRTNLDEKSLQKIMKGIREGVKGLYVERAHGREVIIFVSEDENLCKQGVASFLVALKMYEDKA